MITNYTYTKNYSMKWEVIGLPHYKWSECKQLINTKTNRLVTKTIVGGSIGYYIDRKFIPLTKLKQHIQLITKQECPF